MERTAVCAGKGAPVCMMADGAYIKSRRVMEDEYEDYRRRRHGGAGV